MSGVFICGPFFEMGGEAPYWDLFTILLYHFLKKSRKEMASLCKNGQEYKCPFFKSARQMLQKASPKNRLLA